MTEVETLQKQNQKLTEERNAVQGELSAMYAELAMVKHMVWEVAGLYSYHPDRPPQLQKLITWAEKEVKEL